MQLELWRKLLPFTVAHLNTVLKTSAYITVWFDCQWLRSGRWRAISNSKNWIELFAFFFYLSFIQNDSPFWYNFTKGKKINFNAYKQLIENSIVLLKIIFNFSFRFCFFLSHCIDSQQKHNPKPKHSAPNHNVASQSNKGKAAPQPESATNMVANVQHTTPASAKEQPQSESKPVPVAVQQEQTKVDNTNSGRISEKSKQPPQQAEKVHSEESVTKRYVRLKWNTKKYSNLKRAQLVSLI